MTLFYGLTGSIGMGKSTTAEMFRKAGIDVYDADATVHNLYAGRAAPVVEEAFPGTVTDGIVDRQKLSRYVIGDEAAMKKLESLIHPMVRQEEEKFRTTVSQRGAKLAVLDNPLLFEMGAADKVDGVILVTAPAEVQRERVLQRPGMTVEKFNAILARQMPDSEKRKRADFIVDTSLGLDHAEQEVTRIIEAISNRTGDQNA